MILFLTVCALLLSAVAFGINHYQTIAYILFWSATVLVILTLFRSNPVDKERDEQETL